MDHERSGEVIDGWPGIVMPPPHDRDGPWVEAWVDILNVPTGETRRYTSISLLEEDGSGPALFIWTDGNYSCDCNRALFFLRAAGDDEDWDAIVCGDGGYKIRMINPLTGALHYDEIGGEADGSEEGRRKEARDQFVRRHLW